MNKLIVILGPTASGKSDLAVRLAKKFNGEIISADSRQVYKGLDIGSGKITKKEMRGVPHYLLDVASPKRKFTVAQFQKLAQKKIKEIQKRGKLPFLVGGTGFYIQSIVDGIKIPEVKPNWKLRKKFEKKSLKELFLILKKLDQKRAFVIDKNNKVRIIRAIEIVEATKKPVPPIIKDVKFESLQIGITKSKKQLKSAIRKRLIKRLNHGMITEIRRLRRHGLTFGRLEEFGLEYRYVAQYLQEKITYQQMIEKIQKESERFAKRQMTWFKSDKRIHWIEDQKEAERSIKKFIKQKPLEFSNGSLILHGLRSRL
ncbi:MAG: tRNA (adenosine(37)-N6)-dimethylallyltransferase MiaA [Patescibacteria group bacterium]